MNYYTFITFHFRRDFSDWSALRHGEQECFRILCSTAAISGSTIAVGHQHQPQFRRIARERAEVIHGQASES